MSQHLKAVLFDLDGTLLDTAPDFERVLNQLLLRHQRPPLPFAAIRATVSHGARALIALGFGLNEEDEGFEALRQELLALYLQYLAIDTRLFEGLDELLLWLEGENIRWGVVTNKPRIYSEAIFKALQLDRTCATLVCPDDVSRTKPDPEPLLLACQQLCIEPTQAVYIGDHRRDIEAGRNAGMHTIAAAYGYIDDNDPAEHWQAHDCAYTPGELLPILKEKAQGN